MHLHGLVFGRCTVSYGPLYSLCTKEYVTCHIGAGNFQHAAACYTAAIDALKPDKSLHQQLAVLYSNRALANLKLNQFFAVSLASRSAQAFTTLPQLCDPVMAVHSARACNNQSSTICVSASAAYAF